MDDLERPAISRLRWMHTQLVAAHRAGTPCSTSTKGREREDFLDIFLRNCIPPTFRFGSGDIVDTHGSRSGQLDIIIELPFFPSLPLVGATRERLYFMESVGAALEVKSDLTKQWDDVKEAAAKLKRLTHLGASYSGIGTSPFRKESVPLIAVGFQGWSNAATLREKVDSSIDVDAALQITPLAYAIRPLPGESGGMWTDTQALGIMLAHLCAHLTSTYAKYVDLCPYFGL